MLVFVVDVSKAWTQHTHQLLQQPVSGRETARESSLTKSNTYLLSLPFSSWLTADLVSMETPPTGERVWHRK